MSKPTVTLTFAGDEAKLTDAMSRVGGASQKMSNDIGRSSEKVRESGGALETLTDKSDTAEQRFIGMSDIIAGVTDGFAAWNDESLTTGEKVQQLGMAFADVAGGLASFLLPIMGNVVAFMKGPLLSAMSFIAAHPLIFALTALVGVFVLLWTQSEKFRSIVIGVFNTVGNFIRDVFGGTIGWIVDRWNDVINFFKGIPRAIGDAFGAVGSAIGSAFKGALNVAIDVINWFVDRANDIIYGINVVSPFSDIPYIGHIRRLHSGGVVPGMPGQERLAILEAGETVIPADQSSGGATTMTFRGNTDSAVATLIMKLVRSGDIQLS
jgi:hypothetical protein